MPIALRPFLLDLWQSFETPLYVYGSAVRGDYWHGHSDVDLCAFSAREDTVIMDACAKFGLTEEDFRSIVWKLNGVLIYGRKAKFQAGSIRGELAVYDAAFRSTILQECQRGFNLSIPLLWVLWALKVVYYSTPFLSNAGYKALKRFMFNYVACKKQSAFLLL